MTPDETRSVGSTEGWLEKEAERMHVGIHHAHPNDTGCMTFIKGALRAVHARGFKEGIEKAGSVDGIICSHEEDEVPDGLICAICALRRRIRALKIEK